MRVNIIAEETVFSVMQQKEGEQFNYETTYTIITHGPWRFEFGRGKHGTEISHAAIGLILIVAFFFVGRGEEIIRWRY